MKTNQPLYKRLRTYFDIKAKTRRVTKANDSTASRNNPDSTDYVYVPVTLGFAADKAVGTIRLTKEAAALLKAGMVLSPAYVADTEHKLTSLAIIPARSAVPPEEQRTPPMGGFLWHLAVIAVVAGLLAIIGLIVRLYYVQG